MNWIASFRNLSQAQNSDFGFAMRELLEIPAQYCGERRYWLSRSTISNIVDVTTHSPLSASRIGAGPFTAYFYANNNKGEHSAVVITKAYDTNEEAATAVNEILAIMQDFMQGKTIKVVVKPWKSKANQAA